MRKILAHRFWKRGFNYHINISAACSPALYKHSAAAQQSCGPSYLSRRPACCVDGRDVAGCCWAPWRFRWLSTCCRKFCYISPLCKYKKKSGVGGTLEGEGRGGKERGDRVACASSCSRSRAVPVTFHNFSKPMRRQKAPRAQLMFNVQLLVSFNKCDVEGGIGLQVIKGWG